MKRFFEFYSGDLAQLKPVNVWEYVSYLRGLGLSFNYCQSHLMILRSFLKYCLIHDIPAMHYSKVETAKLEEVYTVFLERDELEKFFQVRLNRIILSLRNTAIFRVLYSTGCRVSELTALNRDQVQGDQILINGKGRKIRLVFLSLEAREAIKNYLDRRTDNNKPLFITHGRSGFSKDRRLTNTMVQKVVRTYRAKAECLKKVTPHTIRHTFATQLIRNGAPLPAIQRLLGHSSIATTQLYLHVTDPFLQEVYAKSHH